MASGKDCLSLEWAFLILALALTILRLVFQRRHSWNVTDGFLIVAWLIFLVQACMDTVLYNFGRYEGKIEPLAQDFSPENGRVTQEETALALKLYFAERVTYYCEMYFLKAAMIAFYYTLIPKSMVPQRRSLFIIAILTGCGWVFTFFLNIFGCKNVTSQWQVGKGFCRLQLWSWHTICAFHIATDLMIYILPVFVLYILDMKLVQKLGVALTFTLGFACIIFATLVQVSFMTEMSNTSSNMFKILEQTSKIIVVCLPGLYSLLSRETWKGLSRIKNILPGGNKSQSISELSTSNDSIDIERLGSIRSSSTLSMAKHKPLPMSTIIVQEDEVEPAHFAKVHGW